MFADPQSAPLGDPKQNVSRHLPSRHMTSEQRYCDVISCFKRQFKRPYNVVLTLCVAWVKFKSPRNSFFAVIIIKIVVSIFFYLGGLNHSVWGSMMMMMMMHDVCIKVTTKTRKEQIFAVVKRTQTSNETTLFCWWFDGNLGNRMIFEYCYLLSLPSRHGRCYDVKTPLKRSYNVVLMSWVKIHEWYVP